MVSFELLVELVIRWMHIFGAIMLVGSTIFMRTVYVPSKELLNFEPKPEFAEWHRKAWARMVMLSSGQLLISGLVSFVLIMKTYTIKDAFPGNIYQMAFGIKFLLALVVFFLAAALSGRSGLAQKLRQREKFWLTVNMALAITVVLIAGLMRSAKREEKSARLIPQPTANAANLLSETSTFDAR